MENTLEQVTVNWKCGKCDVMHAREFTIQDQVTDRVEVIELVMMIIINEDEPHLSVFCVRDGVTTDETVQVLLTAAIRAAMM